MVFIEGWFLVEGVCGDRQSLVKGSFAFHCHCDLRNEEVTGGQLRSVP